MTSMLKIRCEEMITQHGEDDPHEIPQKVLETVNKDKLMSLTVKNDRTVAINVSDFEGIAIAAPLALPPPTKGASTAPETVKPPATPAKRLRGQNKAKQA